MALTLLTKTSALPAVRGLSKQGLSRFYRNPPMDVGCARIIRIFCMRVACQVKDRVHLVADVVREIGPIRSATT